VEAVGVLGVGVPVDTIPFCFLSFVLMSDDGIMIGFGGSFWPGLVWVGLTAHAFTSGIK
jgi:hypothetical protein